MVGIEIGHSFAVRVGRGELHFDTPCFLFGIYSRFKELPSVWSMERTPGCCQVWVGRWEVIAERRHMACARL